MTLCVDDDQERIDSCDGDATGAAVLAYNFISALRQQIKPSWRIHGTLIIDWILLLLSALYNNYLTHKNFVDIVLT